MEDMRRQSQIEYLKKMQYELQHVGRGELLKIVASKFGEDWAGVVAKCGIEDISRQLLSDQIEAQLHELGE